MGVPALFRWLSKKYPKIISPVEEEVRKAPREDGTDGEQELPIDMSGPNPNGEEFDCLYLDMNGIVHPCTHPEGKPAPETEEEMMLEIFAYTERVVNMIRPRRLLMMAIDGVAPRAKMNQQRSRRFRAAQEAKDKEEERVKALEEWKALGLPVTDEAKESKKAWDSNAITPGTPFMDLLASSLRYWVAEKLNNDPGWRGLQVIISDASVPGEGEHKIMDFIRRQRSHAEHDANTKHVIYGLDADLIMLSLATHEPYFKVLREDVFAQEQKSRKCHRCGREGHIAANCIGEAKPKQGEKDDVGVKPPERKPFIFLDVVALREYLAIELNIPGLPFKFDLERAIDDWVFLIFFVGNDFLPHLPSLEIREGAIDSLLRIWKKELPRMGSYLTNHGKVEMKNAQIILEGVALQEDDIFRRRKEQEDRQEANTKRRKVEDHDRQRRELAEEKDSFKFGEQKYGKGMRPNAESQEQTRLKNEALAAYESGKSEDIIANQRAIRLANLSAAEKLKAELKGKAAREGQQDGSSEVKDEAVADVKLDSEAAKDVKIETQSSTDESEQRGVKRTIDDVETDEKNGDNTDSQDAVDPVNATNVERKVQADGTVEVEDTVKLWEPGYRERYYQQKFGVSLDDKEFRRNMVKSYMEGMSWVLAYYYQGCPSWTWYYPYHFSPFAVDFVELDGLDITFDTGKPFRPYDQLMGVLPAASRASIPKVFHSLMTDEDSEIIDFYPEEFSIDMNGKKMAWQGVALLPFIDETRLLDAINKRYDQLSEDELRRNSFGDHALLVSEENKLYDEICALYAKRDKSGNDQSDRLRVAVNPANSGGVTGFVSRDPDCIPGSTFNSPLAKVDLPDLLGDRSISALYEFPEQLTPHRSVLLKGVQMPKQVLTHEDREFVRRGPQGGRGRGGGRGGGGGGGGRYGHHSMHMDDQNRRQGAGPGQGQGRGGHGGGMRFGNGPQNGGYGAYGGAPQPQQAYGGGGGGYGGYGGYGGGAQYAQHGYGGQAAPDYGSYGGYGGGGAYNNGQAYGQPPVPPPQAYGGGSYGGYGGYGGDGGAPAGGYGGGYGGYGGGQQGGYGGGAPYGAPPPTQAHQPAPMYGQPPTPQGQYGAPPAPRSYGGGGGAAPRPMGFRNGDDLAARRGGGYGGGRGGGGGGGRNGRY